MPRAAWSTLLTWWCVATWAPRCAVVVAQCTSSTLLASTLAGGGANGSTSGASDGTGTAALFTSPAGVAVDALGRVIVSDANSLRVVSPVTRVVATLAGSAVAGSGNGVGTAASFDQPRGVAVAADGTIFLTDATSVRVIAPSGAVSTLAGGAVAGYGDGQGTAASFSRPSGVAVAASGAIVVADTLNSVIRTVSPTGAVTTLAGNSSMAGVADGMGTSAQFSLPWGVAVDASGVVIVCDTGNHKLRAIDATGQVITFAGGGASGVTSGAIDGVASVALFTSPTGVAVDAATGVVWVTDEGRVRRIAGGSVTTVTAAAAEFIALSGISVDVNGTTFVADGGANAVGVVYCATPWNTGVDSNGNPIPSAACNVSDPHWIVANDTSTVGFYAPTSWNRAPICFVFPLWWVSTQSSWLGGTLGSGMYALYRAPSVRFPSDAFLILSGRLSCDDSCSIRVNGITFLPRGISDSCNCIQPYDFGPIGVRADKQGFVHIEVLVLNTGNMTNGMTHPSGLTVSWNPSFSVPCFALPGYYCSGGEMIICPVGSFCAGSLAERTSCYPASACNMAGLSAQPLCYWHVTTISGSRGSGYSDGSFAIARFRAPYNSWVLPDGTLLLADEHNGALRALNFSSGLVSTQSVGFGYPTGVVADTNGTIYVAEDSTNRLSRVTPAGVVSLFAGGFGRPVQIALYDDAFIYLAAYQSHKIFAINIRTAAVSTLAGTGSAGSSNGAASSASFNQPYGVAVNSKNAVFVADRVNNRVRVIANGVVSTFAGSGSTTTRDGLGTAAGISGPTSIVVDANDYILVATDECRIRRITPVGLVTTLVGSGASTPLDGFGLTAAFGGTVGLGISTTGTVFVSESSARIRQLSCVPCPASYYCSSGTPILCPAGSYCPWGSVNASLCGANTFSAAAGASACSVCAQGWFAGNGATTCRAYDVTLTTVCAPIQYVRVSLSTATYLNFGELAVVTGGVNVALDGVASQSSTYIHGSVICGLPGYSMASYANDGNLCTFSATNLGDGIVPEWWEVDLLNGVTGISSIVLYNRQDGFRERINGAVISIMDAARNVLASVTILVTSPSVFAISAACIPSPSATPSRSAKLSSSSSHSPSLSAMPSLSGSTSGSTSATALPSAAASASSGAQPSTTASPSSWSSDTATRTLSPTPSRTPAPLSCGASPAGCTLPELLSPVDKERIVLSLFASQVLEESPDQPPYSTATLTLRLPAAPASVERLDVACTTDAGALVLVAVSSDTSTPFAFQRSADNSSLSFVGGSSSAAWDSIIVLPVTLAPRLVASAAPYTPATLSCSVTSTVVVPPGTSYVFPLYPPTTVVSQPLIVASPALPLAYDMLLEYAPSTFRSSWGGPPVALSLSGTEGADPASTSQWESASAVLGTPGALSRLTSVATAPPPSAPDARAFALTVSGASHLVLVARALPYSSGPAFGNATVVTVGGLPAPVNWVSPDGMLLSFESPALALLCPSTSAQADCGIQTLVVGDNATIAAQAALAIAAGADPSLTLAYGAPMRPPLHCSPACPADWGASLLAAGPDASASLLLSALSRSPNPEDAASDSGLYYALACVGAYTSPASGYCTNASSPLALQCAWGAGDSCQLCPTGALCPGGSRLYPRVGYWASSQSALPADVVECAPPDAALRCPGAFAAGAVAGSFPCGRGYRTGTVGCAGCDSGFYPSNSGACNACPQVSFVTGVVLPIATVLGGAALTAAVVAALVYAATRRGGGTLRGSLERTMHLVIWLWTALQVLVQAGRAAQTTAPPALSAFFRGLSVLQFEGVVANAACLSAYPFVTQWSQLGLIAVIYALLAATAVSERAAAKRRGGSKGARCAGCRAWLPALAGASLQLLVVLYAMLTNTVLTALTCTSASLTVRGYLALAQDGSALLAAAATAQGSGVAGPLSSGAAALLAPGGYAQLRAYASGSATLRSLPPALARTAGALLGAPLSFPVLASDPFTVCYEAQHARLYHACWAALVLFCVAFPVGSLLWVYARVDARMRDASIVGSERAAQWLRVRGAWHPLLGWCLAVCRVPGFGSVGGNSGSWGCSVARKKRAPLLGDAMHGGTAAADAAFASVANPLHAVTLRAAAINSDGASRESAGVGDDVSARLAHALARSGLDGSAHCSDALSNDTNVALSSGTRRSSDAPNAADVGGTRADAPFAASTHHTPLLEARALLDASPKATFNALISPWTVGNTLPSRFAFAQVDEAVLLILSVSVAYNTQSSGLGGRSLGLLLATQAGGLAASLLVTLTAAVLVWRAAPYPREYAWKARIKAGIYALSALSAVSYFVSWWSGVVASGRASSFAALPVFASALSLVVLVAAALLLVALLALFVSSLIVEARAEGAAERAAKAAVRRAQREAAAAAALAAAELAAAQRAAAERAAAEAAAEAEAAAALAAQEAAAARAAAEAAAAREAAAAAEAAVAAADAEAAAEADARSRHIREGVRERVQEALSTPSQLLALVAARAARRGAAP